MKKQTDQRVMSEILIIQTLGDEEEAWYHSDGSLDSIPAIKQWIRQRVVISSSSGNPLEDEEDAWARS